MRGMLFTAALAALLSALTVWIANWLSGSLEAGSTVLSLVGLGTISITAFVAGAACRKQVIK